MAQNPDGRREELEGELWAILARTDPGFQAWVLQTVEELLTDLEAHTILAQVWPEMPGPDPETWQPSTPPPPPPGWGWAEYNAFRAGLLAGRQSTTRTKGRGQ